MIFPVNICFLVNSMIYSKRETSRCANQIAITQQRSNNDLLLSCGQLLISSILRSLRIHRDKFSYPRYCPTKILSNFSFGFHRFESLFIRALLPEGASLDSWRRSACYPWSSFYPLSFGPPMRDRRITSFHFRDWSTRWSSSKASLCACTSSSVSIRAKLTLVNASVTVWALLLLRNNRGYTLISLQI